MAEVISHPGTIIDITPEFTTVKFTAPPACSSCHASGFCGASENEEKIIQIPTTLGNWEIGQEVEVCLKRGMGFKAVWLSYVIPLAVLLAVLLLLVGAGVKEWLSGLLAIAATAVYYLILWLFREKLSNEYIFYIKEKS